MDYLLTSFANSLERAVREMDEKIERLIEWISVHAEKESSFLYPEPGWNVDAHALLDEIAKIYGIDTPQMTNIVESELKGQ